MKKIYKKETINNAMHVMRCPECGNICASASEREFLPVWTTCNICSKSKEQTVFKIYEENGKQIIERLIFPRFKGEIDFNSNLSDVNNIQMIDETIDALELSKSLREAGEFIINYKNS